MKKIFLLPIVAMLFLASACEKEDSLDPLPVKDAGQYVRLDITNKVFAHDHMDATVFGGELTTPGNKVQKYELFVRRTNSNGIVVGNYVQLLTVESFPAELSITPQMIATALGINVADMAQGEVYRFLGYSYGFDGQVINYNNLSATVKAQAGMKQGYKFMTTSVLDDYFPSHTIDGVFGYDNYQL